MNVTDNTLINTREGCEADLFAKKLLWILVLLKGGASKQDVISEIENSLTKLGQIAPQPKREPLSDFDIVKLVRKVYTPTVAEDVDMVGALLFAKLVEEAHGIGV